MSPSRIFLDTRLLNQCNKFVYLPRNVHGPWLFILAHGEAVLEISEPSVQSDMIKVHFGMPLR